MKYCKGCRKMKSLDSFDNPAWKGLCFNCEDDHYEAIQEKIRDIDQER